MSQPARILVVDDEQELRSILRTFLGSFGYQVIEAADGRAGLEACRRERPDLVLLDINMPGMNGFEVCRSIKAEPDLVETPVVFLSSLVNLSDLLDAFAAGGVDYLRKPFQFDEMKARVRTHLELRWQRQELEEHRRKLQASIEELRREQHELLQVNERLRVSEELKSRFIAHMRSEFNDPLGGILGLAEEILDSRTPQDQVRGMADRIRALACDMDFQFRNIFCAAELEAGEASPSFAQVDVASVLHDVASAFSSRAKERGQTLEVLTGPDLPRAATDAGKLRTILANLLSNALEFSPAASLITLRAIRRDSWLDVQVQDRGVGVPSEQLPHLFERFRRFDPGDGLPHKGQGLGLSVVQSLLDLLGGQIHVESQPGLGSVFTCCLPLLPQTEVLDSFAFDGNLFIFEEPRES